MKKAVLKDEIGRLTSETYRLERELANQRDENRKRAEEIDNLRTNWRPVPITHEWQPRNPQCALCDDPRDSVRHGDPS
jgi:chromosome segregation ATPase